MSVAPPEIPSLDLAFSRGEIDLRAVYDAHSPLVYSLCRRALGAEAAKDATQEVFVSAWRKRDQFDPSKGALGAWLVGITKRRIIDQARSEGRHADRRADEVADDRSPAKEPSTERVVDRMFAAHLLSRLPDRTREVIELVYVHDLTHQEVAERTGLPIGTVKSDVRRGIKRIRDEMHDHLNDETEVSHV
ncbi:RNA polymerase sigma factor [Ilumatobacter sp.]|uniref:RNA polymerase sigma factor n=1 Tax=Ilumatobacter sp. TaxID=1967498 RepID=UPI003AF89F5E